MATSKDVLDRIHERLTAVPQPEETAVDPDAWMHELTDMEKEASFDRLLGLHCIYALKAELVSIGLPPEEQASIATGRLMTLDCFLMIGEYADEEYQKEKWFVLDTERARQRVLDQADFLGKHMLSVFQGRIDMLVYLLELSREKASTRHKDAAKSAEGIGASPCEKIKKVEYWSGFYSGMDTAVARVKAYGPFMAAPVTGEDNYE